MDIGKNIITLRKEAGLTQEELASQIGVSAQAVSKWETGVSMPDILLLPVIADVFDITVDELYNRKPEKPAREKLNFNDVPETTYHNLVETICDAWDDWGDTPTDVSKTDRLIEQFEKSAKEAKEASSPQAQCATLIASDRGGIAFANADMGIVLRNFGTTEFLEILNSENGVPVLETIADQNVRRMLAYFYSWGKVGSRVFTPAAAAKKTGLTVDEVKRAMEKIRGTGLLWIEEQNVEDAEGLELYTANLDIDKPMHVCLILMLAERFTVGSYYHGYRGIVLPVDKQ